MFTKIIMTLVFTVIALLPAPGTTYTEEPIHLRGSYDAAANVLLVYAEDFKPTVTCTVSDEAAVLLETGFTQPYPNPPWDPTLAPGCTASRTTLF